MGRRQEGNLKIQDTQGGNRVYCEQLEVYLRNVYILLLVVKWGKSTHFSHPYRETSRL